MMRLTVILAGALLASACATGPADDTSAPGDASAASERQCFFPQQVNGFTDAGDDRVHVTVGANDVYLFETFGACPDLDFATRIGFDPETPGAICNGLDVDLIVPGPTGVQRCPVRMIRQLSDAEIAARDEARQRED